ncbi:hypothetical protein [Cellulophaga sp. E6(2014)]|uniref:hypothetical protein n=1 Tax=Cellulophaga sp. E6(2014) TaxID=1495334 RepID=UPI00051D852E|nr:hypothetical protein [Cellulophaga sp. E6(2014)]KGK30776.1 hypothetical protein EL45_07590 [Cellulophaga sp. E6(2014)]
MHKVHLHFLQNLDNDSYKFWQIVTLDELPKLNAVFHYTQEYYDDLPNDELDRFKELSFDIGNYYYKTIMDYTIKLGEIDYIIDLVHNIN